ncbi:transposase family protein [Trinickia acidisoli]|uniref:transposase family protein n=1 Tax=Trinickia acidisoli TaxID=2767482 RepID=UPI001A8ED643|nr:transposase family protein [Trinickia acidisoli]
MQTSLVHWLGELDDPRDGPALRYDLTELLVVAVCAILCGAQNVTDIAEWGGVRCD